MQGAARLTGQDEPSRHATSRRRLPHSRLRATRRELPWHRRIPCVCAVEDMTTVRDAVGAGVFASARILAGAGGIARRVHWMHISEILDDFSVFRPDDFIVTTGYGLAQSSGLQEHVIREFARRGVSGVLFKQGYYQDGLTEAALNEADKLALPIFLAPNSFDVPAFTEQLGALLMQANASGQAAPPDAWRQLQLHWPEKLGRDGHVVAACRGCDPPLPAAAVAARVTEPAGSGEGDVHFAVVSCRDAEERLTLARDARRPVGISSLGHGARHLERQRAEVSAALSVAEQFGTRQTFWEEAEPFHLFSAIAATQCQSAFALPLLRRIQALGLHETVAAVCSEPSLAASASRLGIHRNTLTYRLSKLEDEIGLPITRPLVRRWLDWTIWLNRLQSG